MINKDVKMFFADPEDMNFALCRNSDLIEELGQVEFVFSDKTGTLTQNKMEFKKCFVGNKRYGDMTEQDINVGDYIGMIESSVSVVKNYLLDFYDNNSRDNSGSDLYNFYRLLAVCHTVVVDKDPMEKDGITYQASSPDELALIQGAR